MTKLTRAELAQHRTQLSAWQSPAEMTRYVAMVKGDMGSAGFFRQGGVEFLRDAWLAGEFGRLCSCEAVRLVAATEQWPDFEARSADGIERVECAEADVPDRRHGDEYRVAERRRAAGELIIQARISRMTGIVLARIGEIWSDFQRLAASSVVAPWNTQRVNQMTGLCGSISTAA